MSDDFVERRKNPDAHVDEKIDEEMEAVKHDLRRFFNWGIAILAIVGLTTAASIFGFGILLTEQGKQNDKIASQQLQIQNQRRDAIRNTCEDQNTRHDNTVAKFEAAAQEETKNHPEQAAQIQESIQANLQIIDALVPKQDCEALINQSVKPVHGG
jgi:hypothetical protein